MPKWKFLLAGSAALLLALSACGPSRSKRAFQPPPIPEEQVVKYIMDRDLNGDGALTCEDSKIQRARLFAEVDKDENGFLDADEYRSLRWQDKLYVLLEVDNDDKDGDGQVSLEEFQTRSNPYFNRVDEDKNCIISVEEMRTDMQIILLRQRQTVGRQQPPGRP